MQVYRGIRRMAIEIVKELRESVLNHLRESGWQDQILRSLMCKHSASACLVAIILVQDSEGI